VAVRWVHGAMWGWLAPVGTTLISAKFGLTEEDVGRAPLDLFVLRLVDVG